MKQSDRVAMYVAIGEMADSDVLNDVFDELSAGSHRHGSYEKAAWLASHVPFEVLDKYFPFDFVRVCEHCGRPMCRGYLVDGHECFCSSECLHHHFSEEEYLALWADGSGETYFTSWID